MQDKDIIKELERIKKNLSRIRDAFPLMAVYVHYKSAMKNIDCLLEYLKTKKAMEQ